MIKVKKSIIPTILGLFLLINFRAIADEGMWIPMLLEQLNESDMQSKGLRLSAQDIYSINHSSLKDAVCLFAGGCTAEVISSDGLIITNHHCGYGAIQAHSTLEHDYLTNGFWAKSRDEELPNDNLVVTFLVRMENVTKSVLEGVADNMPEQKRNEIIKANIEKIETESVKGSDLHAKIKPFYYGNEYYLLITKDYNDVRLVGAPPSAIGKFGGDTDNWMWPRHTGDFSMFRIYASKENEPAPYSKENVPYRSQASLTINAKGVKQNDFTMVYGFPGTTKEYLPSYALNMVMSVEDPIKVKLRDKRLEIIETDMNADRLVRIQYSGKQSGIANGWKKWSGEIHGLQRINAVEKKKEIETRFNKWVNSDQRRKQEYGNLLSDFEKTYNALSPLIKQQLYYAEAGLGIEMVSFASGFNTLVNLSKNQTTKKADIDKKVQEIIASANKYFKDYNLPTDKKLFIALLRMYNEGISKQNQPDIFRKIDKKFKNDFYKYADYVYTNSFMTSAEKVQRFLKDYRSSDYKKIESDPAFELMISMYTNYIKNVKPGVDSLNIEINRMVRIYIKALREMETDKKFYPDANLTLRLTYGKVDDLYPRDAVHYDYFTTLDGVMEKDNPDIYDYAVPDKLKQLYSNKDFGNYAENGRMHVCFLASNHTTGGNSGSPVLNADGQLIGVNFDRNWEGTMSDLMYDPSQCRNISLDIRYALFIIDKFANAKYLLDEMKIIY